MPDSQNHTEQTGAGHKILRFFRNLLSHSMFLICIACMLWLCGCYYASITPPASLRYLSLLSLTTPFAIAANLFFLLFWLFTRRKWRFILPLIMLGLFHDLIGSVFGYHYFAENDLVKADSTIKVMSWNVHGLGLYTKPRDKSVPWQALEIIRQEQPDILCMPEFYTLAESAMKPYTDTFMNEGGFKDYRFVHESALYARVFLGTAFYSKYPLHNFKEIELSPEIRMMQCDAELPGGKMIRTCFMHLQSFHLKDKEKEFLEEVKKGDKNIRIEESRSFARRFDEAFCKRAVQAESIARTIAESPYPVLVCGDMNDVPGSYAYTTIKGKLNDAFVEKGKGLGRTYNAIFPTLRIDYVLYDPTAFKLLGYKSIPTRLSDHNPVITNFTLVQ